MRVAFFLVLISSVFGALIGIDYGNQFTKAVILAPAVPFEIVATDEGKRKDMSGVSIRLQGGELERVYGNAMGSLCTRFPQNCVTGIKKIVGKTLDSQEAQEFKRDNFVEIFGDDARSNAIKFDFGLGNESYKFGVEELLAMNLNQFKLRGLKELEHNPSAKALLEEVAISVPAFASQETRQSYLDALHLANFSNVLGLVDEGSAVALNYVSSKKFDDSEYDDVKQYHLVYDIGAGSTKATLFSYTPFKNGTIVLEIEDSASEESFGGRLLTHSIYTIILEKFLNEFKVSNSRELSDKTHARLLEAAEKAKIILSANSDYHVSLESIHNDKDFKTTVTRDEFEEINSDLMSQITSPITRIISESDAIKSVKDLNSVILNGGSTRVPFVQKHLSALLGEDKISKNVNADESCAFGTTMKGLKLKTKFEKAKDIRIIDKVMHNFEINDGETEKLIFEKGSPSNIKKTVNLGKFRSSLKLDLYEDGRLFKSYNFEDLTKRGDNLECPSKQVKEIVATFTLDQNKIFDLSLFDLTCVQKKTGFFNRGADKQDPETVDVLDDEELLDEETSSESSSAATNETASANSTETAEPRKKIIRPVSVSLPKPTYVHIKPMSRTNKERASKKLDYLSQKDQQRANLDHVRNVLEAKCYELRSFIDDYQYELTSEITEQELSGHALFVSELIEWLEFDSDNEPIHVFNDKIKEVDAKKGELSSLTEMSKVDITPDGFKQLHEDGSTIAMKVQEYLLEFGNQINQVRQKYERERFDFDKENERVKALITDTNPENFAKLESNLAVYKDALDKASELLSLKKSKFDKVSKKEKYSIHKAVTDKIIEMLADITIIQNAQTKRLTALNEKFETLVERKAKRQQREKLKEERLREEKLKEEEVNEKKESETLSESASGELSPTSNIDANPISTSSETSSSNTSSETTSDTSSDHTKEDTSTTTTTNLEHDEL